MSNQLDSTNNKDATNWIQRRRGATRAIDYKKVTKMLEPDPDEFVTVKLSVKRRFVDRVSDLVRELAHAGNLERDVLANVPILRQVLAYLDLEDLERLTRVAQSTIKALASSCGFFRGVLSRCFPYIVPLNRNDEKECLLLIARLTRKHDIFHIMPLYVGWGGVAGYRMSISHAHRKGVTSASTRLSFRYWAPTQWPHRRDGLVRSIARPENREARLMRFDPVAGEPLIYDPAQIANNIGIIAVVPGQPPQVESRFVRYQLRINAQPDNGLFVVCTADIAIELGQDVVVIPGDHQTNKFRSVPFVKISGPGLSEKHAGRFVASSQTLNSAYLIFCANRAGQYRAEEDPSPFIGVVVVLKNQRLTSTTLPILTRSGQPHLPMSMLSDHMCGPLYLFSRVVDNACVSVNLAAPLVDARGNHYVACDAYKMPPRNSRAVHSDWRAPNGTMMIVERDVGTCARFGGTLADLVGIDE